jgi:hypothetical protein
MTEQKKLKALVRDRMARTGESYTTARAVLVGRRPDRQTVNGPVEHRESALALAVLREAFPDLDEELVCGLGGGIGFLYAVFAYREVAYPLLTVVAQHHPDPWLETVAAHLGVPVTVGHASSPTAAMRRLDERSAAGTSVLVTVSRGHLPWHDGVGEVEAADPYRVRVAGRDGEDYLVDDPCPGEVGSLRTLRADLLSEAWRAHRKGRFELVALEGGVATGVPLPDACRAAVRTTVAHLTGPVTGTAFDRNFGLSGAARLAADLRDTSTRSGWVRRWPDPDGVAYVTDRLARCLTDDHTAVAGTRPLYARYLRRAADLGVAGAAAATEAVEAAGACWQRVCDLAVAAAADPPQDAPTTTALYAALADEVEEAAAHEGRAVEHLSGGEVRG